MKVIIDKIEEEYAVCEKKSKKMMNIKKEYIPFEAKEGDVLKIDFGHITVLASETKNLKKEIDSMLDNLWE